MYHAPGLWDRVDLANILGLRNRKRRSETEGLACGEVENGTWNACVEHLIVLIHAQRILSPGKIVQIRRRRRAEDVKSHIPAIQN